MQQQLISQDDQIRQQRQVQQDATNKSLNGYLNKLSPQERDAIVNGSMASLTAHNNDKISAPNKEETDAYNYSQTPIGKIVNNVKYLGQKVTKGGLQVAKGAAYLANMGANLTNPVTAVNPTQGGEGIDNALNKADKATDFLSKGDVSRVEDSKAMANLGGLAEFLPSAIAGESTGGATFYLQGVGQGKETIEQAEKSGANIDPVVKNAFILGTGAVNGLLMGDMGKGIFKPLTSALKDDVVANITTNAIKEAAGKDITAEGFKDLLQKGAQEWTDKALQGGTNYLKNTKKAIVDLSALNAGNFALKQGVDATNDKPVFNENLGNLATQEGETLKTAPMFGAIGSLHDLSKLTPYSGYKNAIVDNLMQDSSPENVDKTKEFVAQHGQEQGWTPEQIQATTDHIDQIANVTKSLPKSLHDAKVEPAVDLVLNRNELTDQLKQEQAKRAQLDHAINDIPTAHEQFLTDKIDQANDKLRDIATGKRTTYSQERDEKTQEPTGKFLKTVGGKSEEISESRYDLERTERDAKVKPQKTNEQTTPNQEVPIEPPANETGQTGETPKTVDEASGDNKVETKATVPQSEAPTLKDITRNLDETGKPGLNIEEGKSSGGTPELPREQTPVEGYKYVTNRDENGRVNGALEISYYNKDGLQEEPQSVKVVVDEANRRKGIGTSLFKHAEENGIDLSKVRGKDMTEEGKALYDANLKSKGENQDAIQEQRNKLYDDLIDKSDRGEVEKLKGNLNNINIDAYLRNLEKKGILKIKCP